MPERGWYRDPADPTQERFWDGGAWTATTRPAGSGAGPSDTAATAATTTPAATPRAGRPLRWVPGPWPSKPAAASTGDRPPTGLAGDPHPGLVVAYPPPPPPPPPSGYGNLTNRCSRTRRALAGLLDRVVVTGPFLVSYALLLTALQSDEPDETTGGIALLFVLSGLWMVVSAFVDLVVLQGRSGQSVGKRVLRIRLVRDHDGQPLGIGGALARWLIGAAFAFLTCGIGGVLDHLWPLWSKDGKRIVDKWRSCSVIDAVPPTGVVQAGPVPGPTLG
jgi:uncharacterized RDD family membrane protein YckC